MNRDVRSHDEYGAGDRPAAVIVEQSARNTCSGSSTVCPTTRCGGRCCRRAGPAWGWSSTSTISDERFWFRGIVAGEPVGLTTSEDSYAAAWQVARTCSGRGGVRRLPAGDRARRTPLSPHSRSSTARQVAHELWPDWRLQDLREVLLHVITETACHAGHLDAVRELIDGRYLDDGQGASQPCCRRWGGSASAAPPPVRRAGCGERAGKW